MSTVIVNGVNRVLNWRPGRPDFRDKKYSPKPKLTPLPASVSPLDSGFDIWDQGQLGSCTAHGTGFVYAHRLVAEGKPFWMPSRLFIYYCERLIEGDVNDDNGALVRDGLKALAQYGCPAESLWPYDIGRFSDRPPQAAYDAAVADIALEYATVDMSESAIKHALADSNPITFGFTVFDSFMSIGADGVMPMANRNESIDGGHCVAFVGYDDATRRFACRNSWGASWGASGRFYMPYENLPNCDDGWVLTSVK